MAELRDTYYHGERFFRKFKRKRKIKKAKRALKSRRVMGIAGATIAFGSFYIGKKSAKPKRR